MNRGLKTSQIKILVSLKESFQLLDLAWGVINSLSLDIIYNPRLENYLTGTL